MDILNMSIEEKVLLLTETDKAYILGYVDRALMETRIKGTVGNNQAAAAKQLPAHKKPAQNHQERTKNSKK